MPFWTSAFFPIDQCRNLSVKMAALTQSTLNDAIKMLYEYNEQEGEEIILNENRVDEYEDKIGSYLVKLNSKDITDRESKEISLLLHCIGDIERISDHAVNKLEAAQEINAKNRGCFQGGFRLSGFGAGSDGTPPRQGPQVQACPFLQPWTE